MDADFCPAFKVAKAFCSSCVAWERQGSGKAGLLGVTARSQIGNSDGSLAAGLQKLLVEGDTLPYAGAYL